LYNAVNRENVTPLIAVIGPTGAGKSELGIRIAEMLDGEIVNCDSLQIYKYFDIGSAKVAEGDRRGVVHHLMDVAEPEDVFTAGDYGRLARAAVAEIAGRGRVPVVVGGTGFYLRALLDGLPALPGRDEALRAGLAAREGKRTGVLHRLLRRLDAKAAERIHERDVPKTMRALEIRLLTGLPRKGQMAAEPLTDFAVRKLGLFPPRAELYEKLDRRAEWMFENGLVEEVEALLRRGVPEGAKPFASLGYRQALGVVLGSMTRAEALADMRQATRRYAKRQMTWFRHEPGVEAIEGFGGGAAGPVSRTLRIELK
jgi:tRNA dimethylallyltransferase